MCNKWLEAVLTDQQQPRTLAFSILGGTFDLLIAAGVLRGCAVNIAGVLQNGTTNHYFIFMNAFEKLYAKY